MSTLSVILGILVISGSVVEVLVGEDIERGDDGVCDCSRV